MRILAPPGVFHPCSDTWMLADAMRVECHRPGSRVLDVCTGSGALAVSAAQGGASEVTAVDTCRRAVLAARLNARLNRVRVRAMRGDLFGPVKGSCFDAVVSNPPYLPAADDQLPARGPAAPGTRDVTAGCCSTGSPPRRHRSFALLVAISGRRPARP